MKKRVEKVVDYSKNPLSIASSAARQLLKYKKSGSLLDVGTGTGRNALFLAKKGFDVIAVDIRKKNLIQLKKIAKERGIKLKTKHANISTFTSTKKYDVVLSLVSLHFLNAKIIPKVLARIKKYTKIGGLNVITVHTKKNIIKEHSRPHLFRKNELKKYYKDWEILEYREVWGHLFKTESNSNPVKKHRAEIIAEKLR